MRRTFKALHDFYIRVVKKRPKITIFLLIGVIAIVACVYLVITSANKNMDMMQQEKVVQSFDVEDAAVLQQILFPGKQRYLEQVFDEVKIESDIVYAEKTDDMGKSEKLTLNVYQPVGDTQAGRPAIIWIHGGGFTGGSKDTSPSSDLAYEFARKGYVTVSIDYRLRQNTDYKWYYTYKDSENDALDALNWLRKNCDKYNVDKYHIAVGGESAGGNIAIDLAYSKDTSGESVGKDGIFAVVDMYGPDMWNSIGQASIPVLLIHGDADPVVPYANSVNLDSRLSEAGINHEFFTMKGEGHNVRGAYWDEALLRISAFLFTTLFTDDMPTFVADKETIYTTPGESIEIAFKSQNPVNSQGHSDIILPDGWSMDGETEIDANMAEMDYRISLPPDALAGSYLLKFTRTYEGSAKADCSIVPIIVTEPVSIELWPRLEGSDGRISTCVNLLNNSMTLTRSGSLSIVNVDGIEGKTETVKFSELTPGKIDQYFIPYNSNSVSDIRVDLDDGYSTVIKKDISCLSIPYKNTKPSIDGKLDEWSGSPSFSLDSEDQLEVMEDWGGVNDLSAKVFTGWDENNLYLVASVCDDIRCQGYTGGDIWQGDSIQFSVDIRHTFKSYSNGYSEFGFALDENTGEVKKLRWMVPDGQESDDIPDAGCAIINNSDYTDYEIAIPWEYILGNDIKPSIGMVLKLSFMVNDNDGNGRRGWIEYGAGIGNSKDTSLFKEIILIK